MAPSMSDEDAQREFLEKALADGGQWTRYADPKALAALAVLGLALSNLLSVAGPLIHAHDRDSFFGWPATGAFWLAVVCAAITVLSVVRALFSRVEPAARANTPVYFFAHIAAFKTPQDYATEVRSRTASQLASEIAAQAWEVGRIATIKHKHAKEALQWVLAFLVCWATARLMLALT